MRDVWVSVGVVTMKERHQVLDVSDVRYLISVTVEKYLLEIIFLSADFCALRNGVCIDARCIVHGRAELAIVPMVL